MDKKKLQIDPGCITCGLCEFIAPEVFEVTDVSHIKKNVDFVSNNALIEQAAQECPVSVIKYRKDSEGK